MSPRILVDVFWHSMSLLRDAKERICIPGKYRNKIGRERTRILTYARLAESFNFFSSERSSSSSSGMGVSGLLRFFSFTEERCLILLLGSTMESATHVR